MKQLDFLSPPITLFHLERRTHTSKIGGCLVILMSFLYIAYITYLLYHLIGRIKITSIFYQKFQYEAGYYSFNSSSIFHFIQIYSTSSGGHFDKFETKYVRAYTTFFQTNITYSNLDYFDHWVFDTCERDIDDKNLNPTLFENIVNFTNAVCIKYYYNSTEKKYYKLEEEGFKWPHLEHGMSNRQNIYLSTSILKCRNNSIINTILGNCSSQEEIDKYVNKYNFLYLYFTDKQIDPTNYNNPVQQFFQTITTIIGNEKTYIESFIHYSPIKLKTNEGSLFGMKYENNSYRFDYNRKGSAENDKNMFFLTKYYHLMQNNVQVYERRYDNIFDLLSDIGGVIQTIFYAFFWLNYLYNKYIIAYDTNSLFFAVKDNNENNSNKKINDKRKMPIRKYETIHNLGFEKSKKLKMNVFKNHFDIKNNKNIINLIPMDIKSSRDVYQKKNSVENSINFKTIIHPNINKLSIDQNSSLSILKDNNSNIINKNKKITLQNNNLNNNNIKKNKIKKAVTGFMQKDEINRFWLSRESLAKISHKETNIQEILYKKNKKEIKEISFIKFLKDIIMENKKGSNYFLIKFRKHLLSEEHLFKTHVKIILLEKQYYFNKNSNSYSNNNINVYECFNEL